MTCYFTIEYFKLPCYKYTSTAHLYNATHIPSVVFFYSNILDERQKQPTFIFVFKIDKSVEWCFIHCIFYKYLQKRTHECEVQRMRQPTNWSITNVSMQWKHPSSPSTKKFNVMNKESAGKVMITMFWDC
jgi:hypothetical protein